MEKFQDIISKIESMSVMDLAELVKVLEEKFGISAAMPASAVSASQAAPVAVEEKTSFNVILKFGGDQKINVIKIIKEATGLGLKESKAIVDSAPKTVKEGLKKEDAEELKGKLEAVGATVEIQ